MKKFFLSKKGIIIAVVVALLVIIGGVVAIIATQKPKDEKDSDVGREFEVLQEGDSEEVSDDALVIEEPENEAQDMQESGIDFPNDIYDDDYVPNDGTDEEADDGITENPDDGTTEEPDNGNTEEPDDGLGEGTDTSPSWGIIF